MDSVVKEVCPGSYNKALPHSITYTYWVAWYAPWRRRVYRRCWDCDLREEVTDYVWQR
jgi:hypothetical protein